MNSDFPYVTSVRVRTYELDSFGHVNNAQYLHYLEEARSEYLKQAGLSFYDFAANKVHLVIVDAHIRYISSARYGEEITISGRFRMAGPASVWVEYQLTEMHTGRLIATAQTKGAFVDAVTQKPCRAPEIFRIAFTSLDN